MWEAEARLVTRNCTLLPTGCYLFPPCETATAPVIPTFLRAKNRKPRITSQSQHIHSQFSPKQILKIPNIPCQNSSNQCPSASKKKPRNVNCSQRPPQQVPNKFISFKKCLLLFLNRQNLLKNNSAFPVL